LFCQWSFSDWAIRWQNTSAVPPQLEQLAFEYSSIASQTKLPVAW
jgi:hypothetical protein